MTHQPLHQPTSDSHQPMNNGLLQPATSDGHQPTSDGLQANSAQFCAKDLLGYPRPRGLRTLARKPRDAATLLIRRTSPMYVNMLPWSVLLDIQTTQLELERLIADFHARPGAAMCCPSMQRDSYTVHAYYTSVFIDMPLFLPF